MNETKEQLMVAIIRLVEAEIESARRNLAENIETIKNAPNAMQSHSDTTRQQYSYLADKQSEGLNALVRNLEELKGLKLERSEVIGLGSLVEIAQPDKAVRDYFFIVPVGGGNSVALEGGAVRTITPDAPIAAALIGKSTHDSVTMPQGESEITSVY